MTLEIYYHSLIRMAYFFLLNPREPQTLCLWPQACGYYHSVGTISNLRALEEGVADYTGSGVSCQDKCAIRF